MSKKRGLGRGLSALIKDETIFSEERLAFIDVDLITPNPYQPRKNFDEESLEKLSQSIKKDGVIQPIVVVKNGENFTLVVGERRWRAAKRAGLKKIPAILKNISQNRLIEYALLENIHRENLNPIEKAESLKKMNEELGFTHEQIAEILSIDRTSVTNLLRLLSLPDYIKKALEEGKISVGHGKALLSVENEKELKEIFSILIKNSLTVRELEKLIKSYKKKRGRKKSSKKTSLYLKSIEEELRSFVGKKVKIKPKKRGGVLEIHYKNDDELMDLIKFFKGE